MSIMGRTANQLISGSRTSGDSTCCELSSRVAEGVQGGSQEVSDKRLQDMESECAEHWS